MMESKREKFQYLKQKQNKTKIIREILFAF